MSEKLYKIRPLEFVRGNQSLTLGGATFADGAFGRIWIHKSLASGGAYYFSFSNLPHRHKVLSEYYRTENEAIDAANEAYEAAMEKWLEPVPR